MLSRVLPLILFSVFTVFAAADTLHVPADFDTIQAAIDAAQSDDTVHVAAGEYHEPITLKSGITLEGDSSETVTIGLPAEDGHVLIVQNAEDVIVRSLTFQHNTPAAEDGKSLAFIDGGSVTIESCVFRDSGRDGLEVHGACVLTMEDSTVDGAAGNGLYVDDEDTDLEMNDCTVQNSGFAGIRLDDCLTAKIVNCVVSNNGTDGIAVYSEFTDIEFTDNDCSHNGAAGMRLDSELYGTVSGNTLQENMYGLKMGDALSELEVTGNSLVANCRMGLTYGDGSWSTFSNNTFTDNGEIGPGHLRQLYYDGDFDTLEKLAHEYRTEKTRDRNAGWVLDDFYEYLTDEIDSEDDIRDEEYFAQLEAWKKARPDSITWRVVEAMSEINLAWRFRDSGTSDTVTQEGWEGFHEHLEHAWELLEAAEAHPVNDPEIYGAMIVAAMGLDMEESSTPMTVLGLLWELFQNYLTGAGSGNLMDQIMARGIESEPLYYDMYQRRLTSLLPRWGGSPEEVVAFAGFAADKTAELEGDSLYLRIASATYYWEGRETFLDKYDFDWPRIRQGGDDLLELYPDTEYWLNRFALFACLFEDQEKASVLFALIGDEPLDDVWDSDEFMKWQSWAIEGAPFPINRAMLAAIENDDRNAVASLLKEGVDPNSQTLDGESLLYQAVNEGSVNAVSELLEAGAAIDTIGSAGYTPLTLAVYYGHTDISHLLLRKGADVNFANTYGATPLMVALMREQPNEALYLLKNGADPALIGNSGWTAAHYAADKGYVDVLEELAVREADLDAQATDGVTPLLRAAINDHNRVMDFLLDYGADPNRGLHDGWTPLFEVVDKGRIEFIEKMFAHGGDPLQQQDDGWSLYHMAVMNGAGKVLDLLVAQSSEGLQFVTDEGRTLLHQAAKSGHADLAEMLIAQGLDVNAVNSDGQTPLDLAIEFEHEDVADVLRAHGGTASGVVVEREEE